MAPPSKTGGGVGTNQYSIRGQSRSTPVPDLITEPKPQRVRCGDLWWSTCKIWVQAPTWSHAQHPTRHSKLKVVTNTELSPHVLTYLANDPDPEVRSRVARNSKTPQPSLEHLASDRDYQVRRDVVNNPHASSQAIRDVVDRIDQPLTLWDQQNLAGHNNTPSDALYALLGSMDDHVKQKVVEHPATPPESAQIIGDPDQHRQLLSTLAASPQIWHRHLAASNPQTPPEVLDDLADDADRRIRLAVIVNTATPNAAFIRRASDNDIALRQAMSVNQAMPARAIEILTTQDLHDYEYRQVLGLNNVPESVITTLADSRKNRISALALGHPKCPLSVLAHHSDSPDWYKRLGVANSDRCPPEILTKLFADTSQQVRQAALHNPNCPDHIRTLIALAQ